MVVFDITDLFLPVTQTLTHLACGKSGCISSTAKHDGLAGPCCRCSGVAMPSILVRLNLPGFASPEPFRLANAPASISGLACAVLQEIGGFNKEELEAVQHHLDQVPLKLLGELCEDKLIELASDAELAVFLDTAESPKNPAIIEVRPRDGPALPEVIAGQRTTQAGWQTANLESPVRGTVAGFDASPETAVQEMARTAADCPDQRSSRLKNGWHDSARPSEWSERELKEQLDLQRELEEKEKQLQWQQQQLQKQFDSTSGQQARDDERRSEPGLQRGLLPASSSWNLPENNTSQGAQKSPDLFRVLFAMVASSRRAWAAAWILLLARGRIAWSAPLIIDTDMNQDDMAALVYLIRSGADIKGITVSANGFSAQSAGVDNALRLLHKLNRSDIPVAFQEGYLGSTLLNLDYPNGMPPQIWTEASNHYLKRWIATEPSPKPAAWQTAPQLILQILDRAPNNSVNVLELGPYTNLAAALHRSGGAELFRSKVKCLYVQGGKVQGGHAVEHSGAALRGSGTSGAGLATGFPWSTDKKPKNASWNIFLDAISAAQVWAFGLETVLVPDSAFEHLQVEPSDPNMFVPQNCSNKLLSDMVIYWAPSQNQTWSGLRYWDQATAVVVMQRLLDKESVCQKWMKSGIMVSLQNDASYATYLQGSAGARSEVCLATSRTAFLEDFYSADNRDPATAAARRTLQHSPSAPEFASAGQEKTGPSSSRSSGLHGRTTSRQQRSVTPDAPRRHPVRAAAEHEVSASLRVPSCGKHVPKLEREAPVHIRLYQEKDDRRRRLEQAFDVIQLTEGHVQPS
ncbi:rihA [Symbiodinium necroappetens]|uniref:RihA protein n=1 Tax=Symbiodinium necroappetens TaxID=1628268 RepID=A0A813AAS1_9DINO|nr:rihA [Symbiodinium necroappetens]